MASAWTEQWRGCGLRLLLGALAIWPRPILAEPLPQAPDCQLEPGPSRAVARVIDGATVELDDRVRVRLAAVLTPRAEDVGAAAGNWPPETAAQAALQAMVQGRTVALAFAGPRSDRYGHTVAHLFVRQGDATNWVQATTIDGGHGRVFAGPGGEDCVQPLLQREAVARQAGRGLWSNAAYQLRPADRPSELARYRGTFQIVTGRVSRVGGSRGQLILDLANAEATARGMRVVAARNTLAARELGQVRQLADADVVVRGWIEISGSSGSGGPEIALQSAFQLVRDAGPMATDDAKRPADQPPGASRQ
ncbi:MAG: thermonuclease family protein [Hyphomicrobiaceae bacterium]